MSKTKKKKGLKNKAKKRMQTKTHAKPVEKREPEINTEAANDLPSETPQL